MNFYHRNRGAISVFLIIVLVPCIVLSSICVDLGRVQLSKTQTMASADLALNTLLTNYDGDLKEWYGLIGSCQNIDEFYKISAEYYLRNISSQGLNDDELMTLAGVFAAATGDDTIYDLLQVECQTEASAMISPVSGANLKNPTLLKDQVVEFMKYRAPIEISKGLIGKLQGIMNGEKDDIGLTQFMESKENDELVTAKQDFYEAEGDLMTAAYYTYIAIYNYEQKYKELQFTQEKIQQYATTINGYRDVYSQIHEISVQYLLTSGLTRYSRAVYSLEPYKDYNMESRSDVWSSSKTDEETDETTYYINGSDFNTIMNDIRGKITGFETAKRNYEGAVRGVMQISPTDNDVNIIQWWDDMQDAAMMYDGSVRSYGSSLLSCYTKLLVMLECEAEAVPSPVPKNYVYLPSDWESQCRELRDKIYNYVNNYLDGTPDRNDPYVQAADKLTEVSHMQSNWNLLSSANHYVKVDGQSMNIDNALKHMSNNMTTVRKNADTLIKLLDIAIYGDGNKTKSLDSLWSLASTYKTNYGTYNKEANESTTNMGKTERDTIANELKMQSEINTTAVTELKTRLVNIRSQLVKLRDGIDGMKYGNTPVKSINSFAPFKTQAITKVSESSITVSVSRNKSYASQTFTQLFKPSSGNAIGLLTVSGDSHNPDLTKTTPKLLTYMQKEFGDAIHKEPKVAEGEKDEEKAKGEQDNFEKTAKGSANKYRGGGSGIKTSEGSTTAFSASDLLNSVIGTVKALVGGDLDGIRDDVYVTTYMMEMFSYATYDREAMYSKLSDEQKKSILASDPEATFKSAGVMGDPSSTDVQEGTWYSTKETDTYNKSLTNHLINKANNKSYLAEIEYILYGQATPQENLKKSFGHIYTIRMVLNTVSGFQHFWGMSSNTGKLVNGVSTAISGAFGGIIPAPVIKAVLIPMLALVETCMDNQRLAAGLPVELYKVKAEDWWISLSGSSSSYSGFFNLLSGGLTAFEKDKNQDKGLYYSDYLILFVYSGLAGGGDLENDMYVRMSELIEHNMRKQNGIPSGYTLSKTQMYFTLNATFRVKPLMVTLAYFDEYDSSMETATDWCTYSIKITRGYT